MTPLPSLTLLAPILLLAVAALAATRPNSRPSKSTRTHLTGRRLSSAVTAIDSAIAGSTHNGEACVRPKVASIRVMEWPIVKAVTVRSSASQLARLAWAGLAKASLS